MLLAHALRKVVEQRTHPAFGFREAKTLLVLYAHPALGVTEASFLTHVAPGEQQDALEHLCALRLACKKDHRFALHPRYLDGIHALLARCEKSRVPARVARAR